MKKVTAFVGSPRRNGNTDTLVQKLLEGISIPGLDHEILYLSDYHISGCRGCYSCSRTGKCINEDDMMLLYQKLEQSDVIILASPTYNYNITSEMKAFIDRLFCYYQFSPDGTWTSRLGNNKSAIVIGVCAGPKNDNVGPEEDSMGYTIQAMKRPLGDLGIKVIKEIRYYNTRNLPVRNNTEFQNEMVQIGLEQSSFIYKGEPK